MRTITLTEFETHLIKQSLENFNKFVENNQHWNSITPKDFVLTRLGELLNKINSTEKIK